MQIDRLLLESQRMQYCRREDFSLDTPPKVRFLRGKKEIVDIRSELMGYTCINSSPTRISTTRRKLLCFRPFLVLNEIDLHLGSRHGSLFMDIGPIGFLRAHLHEVVSTMGNQMNNNNKIAIVDTGINHSISTIKTILHGPSLLATTETTT